MKKTRLRLGASCLVVVFSLSTAFGWGSATHAYIAERLNNKLPLYKLNQVYGAMAPDIFNLVQPVQLSFLPHCTEWKQLWRLAALPTGKALAFGFVSHNQDWGADAYAHFPGCYGQTPTMGYIQERASDLYNFLLVSEPTFVDLVNRLGKPLIMELLRDLVEYAVDILVKRADSAIGAKVMFASALRSPEFPLMLVAAYSDDVAAMTGMSRPEAAKFIISAESDFQKTTFAYGQALLQPEDEALQLISHQLTVMAGAYGIPPEDEGLITGALQAAMQICQSSFKPALDETILKLAADLNLHNIRY